MVCSNYMNVFPCMVCRFTCVQCLVFFLFFQDLSDLILCFYIMIYKLVFRYSITTSISDSLFNLYIWKLHDWKLIAADNICRSLKHQYVLSLHQFGTQWASIPIHLNGAFWCVLFGGIDDVHTCDAVIEKQIYWFGTFLKCKIDNMHTCRSFNITF